MVMTIPISVITTNIYGAVPRGPTQQSPHTPDLPENVSSWQAGLMHVLFKLCTLCLAHTRSSIVT